MGVLVLRLLLVCFFFFQAEDGIRDLTVTGVQTCALPIYARCGLRSTLPARSSRSATHRRRAPPRRSPQRACRSTSHASPHARHASATARAEIGRASCRERVENSGDGGAVKKKGER